MDISQQLEQAQRQIEFGQIDGAIHSLKHVLSIDPDFAEAHAYLALCLLEKKRLHAAVSEAGMALALDAELELAHYVMAHVLIAKRDFKQAESHVTLLLESNPNHPHYYLLQADLYLLTHRKNQILPLLEKALTLAPESTKVLAELSQYYASTGDLDKAQHYAQASLKIEASNVDGLIAMGEVLLRQGNIEEAREHAIWALRQAPDNRQALTLMAGIKARKNPVLGLWWRYNTWMSNVGSTRSILILLCAYIIYRLAAMIAGDVGREGLSSIINIVWLGIVIYTFIGPAMFEKSLKKELADVRLREGF